MSDLDLSDPFGFERPPEAMPRKLPPPVPTPVPVPAPVAEVKPEAPSQAAETTRPDEKAGPTPPTPWKGAASSVPKLRQQPAPLPEAISDESFQGFAQDAIEARSPAAKSERAAVDSDVDDVPNTPRGPLAHEPAAWEVWLDRARSLPLPMVLGVCAVIALTVVLVQVFSPRDHSSVSLSRIRQHPEAFDGQRVEVSGRAGEGFMVGGNYVFNLRQGRDTIVVYSRSRRPALHENVQATGTVSIGYLDGEPRVALFEEPRTP
jgi:hypothetical protein